MCGIFAAPSREEVATRIEQMRHRGPDASTIVSAAGWHIGFARLAIVGVKASAAEQPHVTAKGCVLAFNGEIYNYRDLDPNASSEVALLGDMLDAGLDPRQFLDGDYAILYYDPATKLAYLYRDRFGSCPLYYQTYPFLAVSSEARRLANPHVVPAHGAVCLSPGVREDWPRYKGATDRVIGVSAIPLYGATSQGVDIRGALSMLEQAVLSRAKHTDLGFSLALSGGLDSSLIAYILAAYCIRPVCYTTYFSKDSEDLACARIVADQLKLPLVELQVGNESSEEVLSLYEHLDGSSLPSPLRYRGGLRTWAVAKAAGTKVVLCGDGADELLGGYPHHFDPPGSKPWVVQSRCLDSIEEMPFINLDRTNKLGMAHSKEFRSPFLASTISSVLLSSRREQGKMMLRWMLRRLGAPTAICDRVSKYSPDELAVETLPDLTL